MVQVPGEEEIDDLLESLERFLWTRWRLLVEQPSLYEIQRSLVESDIEAEIQRVNKC